MPFSSRTALRAPSHPATHAAVIFRLVPSGCLSVAVTLTGFLLEADQLGVPLHRHAQVAKLVAHDPFVVVLAEDQDEGIGRHVAARLRPAGTRAIFRPCAQMLAPVPRLPSSSARSTMPSLA